MRSRYPYVQSFIDSTGAERRYFRRKGRPLVPLPGKIGSPEFLRAYEAALEGGPAAVRIKAGERLARAQRAAGRHLEAERWRVPADAQRRDLLCRVQPSDALAGHPAPLQRAPLR
jgi:hypothetical protein